MVRYWVVSPNVWNDPKTVETWKRRILKGQVFMGYDPDKPAGKKGKNYTGLKFAGKGEDSVHIGDIIFIARSRENQDIVGAGIVASQSISRPFLESENKLVQVRKLKRFKDLRKINRPEPIKIALSKSLPYKGYAAMRELRDSAEDKIMKEWLKRILDVNSKVNNANEGVGSPRQLNIPLRHEIEESAYKTVMKYYNEKHYDNVHGVQKENLGWDLEATKNTHTLKIEVKGLQGPVASTELTPNEFDYFKKQDKYYRLCIVTNALKRRPKKHIHIFTYSHKKQNWLDQHRKKLNVTERIGAKVNC